MISFVTVTHNSEGRLPRLLKQARYVADEVIVFVDSSTTDDTMSIAEMYADLVKVVDVPDYIEPLLENLCETAKGDWIIRLDDDELLSTALAQGIDILTHTNFSSFMFPRYNIVSEGKYLASKPWYPDLQVRLFKKGSVIHHPIVHLTPEVIEGTLGVVPRHHIYHMKYLYKSKEERQKMVSRYDAVKAGAGSGVYHKYHIPEDYKGVILPVKDSIYNPEGEGDEDVQV